MSLKKSLGTIGIAVFIGIIVMSIYKCNVTENKHNKAQKALANFLHCTIEEINCKSLAGGLAEGTVNRCQYKDKAYLVKLFEGHEELGKKEIAWTHHASDLGVGPHMHYGDLLGTFLITEFVQGHSLTLPEAHNPIILKNLAHKLLLLHTSSAPWAQEEKIMPRIEEKYKNLTLSSGPLKEMLEKDWQILKKTENVLQSMHVPATPCQNDLNPRNIFVGENSKITIIDWGDASLSNPYYDVAVFSVLHQLTKEAEIIFLQEYNPLLLEPVWQNYFKNLKQMVRFEFALNLLGGVEAENKKLLDKDSLPKVEKLEIYIKSFASYTPLHTEFLYSMALASLNQFSENMQLQYIIDKMNNI
jgi:hypothetical protein